MESNLPALVTFEERLYSNPNILIFGVWNNLGVSSIYVLGYKNGIVTISAFEGTLINDFLKFVVGIFNPKSNFALTVSSFYNVLETEIEAVEFDFNGVHLLVNKDNANEKNLFSEWKKRMRKAKKENN